MSDLINLIERVIQNEQAIKDLRKELAAARKEAADAVEEIGQENVECIPVISKDGKGLVFKTYDNDTSERVFAVVAARVSSSEPETLA